MSRSRSRSRTSVLPCTLALLGALPLVGCGTPCGPGDAPDSGLVASSDTVTLTYGQLVAGANNDCPAADAPAGVVSLTIAGVQTDGGGLITLCVPRPDELQDHALSLGSDVQVIDLTGDSNGCTYTLDTSRPPSGNVSSQGMCDHGTNPAGFALVVSGALSLQQTCNGMTTSIAVQLAGTVAVAAQ